MEFFLSLVNRSITAGIVILAVLPVRELLKRLRVPRRYIYLLWIIPALRLLCPFTLSSVVSLFNLPIFDRAVQTQTGLEYLPEELSALTVSESRYQASDAVQNGSYGMDHVRQNIGEQANYYGYQVFATETEQARQGSDALTETTEPNGAADVDWGRIALIAITGVWLAGMTGLTFRQLYAYSRIRRRVACAVRLTEGKEENVYECEGISTPFVMGLFHSRIYIPFRMPLQERQYVLMHEQYHIKHGDLWVKMLACALETVYWYNPLVWVAIHCMEQDMEMRCDEHVLRQLGEKIRYDYSMSLLSFASGKQYKPMGTLAFGESGTGRRVNHVLQYKKVGICIVILAVIAIAAVSAVCLTDRQPQENPPQATETPEKTYFWGQQELQLAFADDGVPAMSLAGRSEISFVQATEDGSYGSSICCAGEHCFFLVRPFYGADDSVTYEMHIFDGDRKEWSSGLLDIEPLEQGYLYHMFAVSDDELVYLISVRGEEKHYYAVHMNRAGEELYRVDLLPICQELGMVEANQALPSTICVDNQGRHYIVSIDGRQMAIVDREGNLIGSRDCSSDYKLRLPIMVTGPDGGILTLVKNEEKEMEWLWLDGMEAKRLQKTASAGSGDQLIPGENGSYYYVTGMKKIYQGNAADGASEFLFDAGSLIGTYGLVAVNEEKEVLVFSNRADRAVVYVLNRAGETRMGEGGVSVTNTDPVYAVSIAGMWYTGDVENTLPTFMADHPEYAFELQVVPQEERDAVHDRVWNELIAGSGPDLIWISQEDLPVLYEKGVLMDLKELISQETLDQIYPGLLATGMIDDRLAGVSVSYNVRTMLTAKDVWAEEEWTVEDVVKLLESGQYPHAIHQGYRYGGSYQIMNMLVYGNMADSPFIDMESGSSCFDSDLFIRVLKAAKRYQNNPNEELGTEDEYQSLLSGDCMAIDSVMLDERLFVMYKQALGDQYNCPGIPGATGSAQVVVPLGYVVVNKNCKNKEAVAAYLEYLLSVDNANSFRRDYRNTFWVEKDWEGKWAICYTPKTEGVTYSYLLDKNDPAIRSEEMPDVYVQYLEFCEEYYAYMEALGDPVSTDQQIQAIIEEEVENYFQGSQSAEHVAEVIQNRVQIYMNERR